MRFTKCYDMLMESWFFDEDDFKFNYDKWVSGKVDKLIVVGLSGSGKTYSGERLAEEYSARFVDLDDLPQFTDKNILFQKRCDDTVRHAMALEGRIVAVGIQFFFVDGSRWISDDVAVVVKGTSVAKSSIRAFLRQYADYKGTFVQKMGKIADGSLTGNIVFNFQFDEELDDLKRKLRDRMR